MRAGVVSVAVLLAVAGMCRAGSPWPASASQQAAELLAKMNITEKLFLLHGYGGGYVGDVPPMTQYGLPPINLEDGPQGVADGVSKVTAWPSALTVVQSWDRNAMYEFGLAMGQEQKIKGTNVMLGPGINLARTPMCGRNFEYQGEDPYLASQMVAPEIAGIQSNNVSACIKHYTVNVVETDRSGMSVNVDQRTWMETYSRGFQAAIDAGVGTAMCSYNRLNGTWACENPETLGYLYGPLGGFQGWMMSDWGATHSTVPAAMAGLTQQMPDAGFFGSALAAAVASGEVPESQIDAMVTRILTPMYALNLVSDPPTGNLGADANSDAHDTLARVLAENSTVLLKNNGLLPLNKNSIQSVLILGDDSTFSGYGSGGVVFPYVSTIYDGISLYLNGPAPPRPNTCTFFPNTDFYQPGNPCVSASSQQDCCNQCTANSACSAFAYVAGAVCGPAPGSMRPAPEATGSGGSCWLKPNTDGNRTSNGVTGGVCAPFPPNPNGKYNVTYSNTQDPVAAAALAAAYDVVILNVATTSGEGSDRPNLDLPAWQDALVAPVVAANKNTVVVARCPGACLMPWVDIAPAIVFSLMPGQEAGNAMANILFGNVNPSGKLPLSFPASMNDTWLSLPTPGGPINPQSFPGLPIDGQSFPTAILYEGLFFGYRWYDQQKTDPLWPFGFGLSYTTFGYTNLAVQGSVSSSASATVSFTVTNTGKVSGSEVAQLYLGFPASTNEPPKLLRGFDKLYNLAPGAAATVTFTVAAAEVQIWDTQSGAWVITAGTYDVYVGSGSRDIRLTGSLTASA